MKRERESARARAREIGENAPFVHLVSVVTLYVASGILQNSGALIVHFTSFASQCFGTLFGQPSFANLA